MNKGELIYEGKAKKIYTTEKKEIIWVEFKNSMTAFNGEKKVEFENKGSINCQISTYLFKYLKQNGVDSHWIDSPTDSEMICHKVEIIPLEVVVRNIMAGSTAKRLGFEEGMKLAKPLVEFYYKKDELNDPFISDDQALLLGAVKDQALLVELKKQALEINQLLSDLFIKTRLKLVDFKIEFGINLKGELILSDEISPDSCRLWDLESNEKYDKDRFRRGMGSVMEKYKEVLQRLQAKSTDE